MLKLAERVVENGWGYGVDFQAKMLQFLHDRAYARPIERFPAVS